MGGQDQVSGVNIVVPPILFLAQNPDVDFRETSFFKESPGRNHDLPSPSEVNERDATSSGRRVTMFDELYLVVKSGHRQHGRLEEALKMRALRKAFPNGEIPVPEVFGWNTIGESEYIYMSLVPGIKSAGPFNSTKDFHDYFQFASLPWIPMAERDFEDPYRPYLSDNASIRFSHGDLHLGNIMVSDDSSEPCRVTSIIDWEEVGRYPEYWEYCKMALVVGEEHQIWIEGGTDGDARAYIDRIFPNRHHDELFAVGEYWAARGYP
ncbi:hypothetical protein LA080_006466 [Diaporthe eres]|nr:hypothetical protein LA080_006466 [Diaporthe eres]